MSQNAANFSVGTDNAIARYDTTAGAVLQNSVPTIDDTGNLSISAAVSGASLSTTVANTSNTASATAFYNAQVAGATASDAYYKAEISGGQAYTWGLDNSDSDSFVISASATPGTTNVMHVTSAGEINYPLQPAFLAYPSANLTDVTGDGTLYQIAYNAERFDQGGDYNTGTFTFTAPVTGRYLFTVSLNASGILVTHTGLILNMTTSNVNNYVVGLSPFPIVFTNIAAGEIDFVGTIINDMDAADTCVAYLTVSGGTKVVDLGTISAADPRNTFAGYLIC